MGYDSIIADMIWSYSRITSFEDCPYRFLSHYVMRTEPEPRFFSDYGSFVHKLLGAYLSGELQESALAARYLTGFRENVRCAAPNEKVFSGYFRDGLEYLTSPGFPHDRILAVEQTYDFQVFGKPFTGVIDCVAETPDGIAVVDHKSRNLKPRSGRSKKTASDRELDKYLRQLYLYAIPVREVFGSYPARLQFNCFRERVWIDEPFVPEVFEGTKRWAFDLTERIERCEKWNPDIEFWKCRYICDCSGSCDYWKMFGGEK